MAAFADAPSKRRAAPLVFWLYLALTWVLAVIAPVLLLVRLIRGREMRARMAERYGLASQPRPDGFLIWIHAASVGEAVSVLPLVERLHSAGYALMMTTGTVTSAKLMARRLPNGVPHQFAPLDAQPFVHRFLQHWRPDLVLFVESELWPVMLNALARGAIAAVLVNARMSLRSSRRWARAPRFFAHMMGAITLCLAQSESDAARFKALGAGACFAVGNLKYEAPPLACEEGALAAFCVAVGARCAVFAASTHSGEEGLILAALGLLRGRWPDALLVIAPRHPARAEEITRVARTRGFTVARRSAGDLPKANTDVYLADTIGEMGLFYRAVKIVVLGNSLKSGGGGQNPIEAAHFACAIVHGPGTQNFFDVYRTLDDAKGALALVDTTPQSLANCLQALLASPATALVMGKKAQEHVLRQKGALEKTLKALVPFLPEY